MQILASISVFGQTGPYRMRAGFGEHTVEMLHEPTYGEADIDRFRKAKVV